MSETTQCHFMLHEYKSWAMKGGKDVWRLTGHVHKDLIKSAEFISLVFDLSTGHGYWVGAWVCFPKEIIHQARVLQSWVKITHGWCEIWLQVWRLYNKNSVKYFCLQFDYWMIYIMIFSIIRELSLNPLCNQRQMSIFVGVSRDVIIVEMKVVHAWCTVSHPRDQWV